MTWNRKHLPIGMQVKLTKGMSVKHKGQVYNEGTITARDGEYYYVTMDFDAQCVCERYLNEIGQVFIAGQWCIIR